MYTFPSTAVSFPISSSTGFLPFSLMLTSPFVSPKVSSVPPLPAGTASIRRLSSEVNSVEIASESTRSFTGESSSQFPSGDFVS